MKKFASILLCISVLTLSLAGCSSNKSPASPTASPAGSATGALKTGFAVISSAAKSKDATAAEAGLAQADTTIAAVTVDQNGKIVKCVIDGIQTKINFSNTGKITTDKAVKVETKTELGTKYGMGKVSSIGKEWSEQAAALAGYVVGKTISEVKGIAVNEKGAPSDKELAASVTVSIGGYIAAIEKAVTNAKDLGAKPNDKLGFGAVTTISKSTDAGEKEGLAQAYSTYAAATFDSRGAITSCILDGSQTNVNFSTAGKITSDINQVYKTKNELGAEYGMGKVSSIGKEWNEQADSLSKYVVGKTINEVKAIAVNEKGAPKDAELASSVTISIGDQIISLEKANLSAK